MRRLCGILVLACALATAPQAWAQLVVPGPAVHVDDGGRTHRFAGPATRVITLAPNLTEIVYAVGAGDAMVGTVSSSDFPTQALALPRVGDHQRLDVERILALRPDLVLAWRHGNPSRELAQLEAAGLPVFQIEPRRLVEVPQAIERVGALVGRSPQAATLARQLREGLDTLRARHAGQAPIDVFYQVWREPLMTLNGEHLIADVIALCGGRQLFAALPQLVPRVSLEAVVTADPEVLLATRLQRADGEGFAREPMHADFAPWRRFEKLRAVRRAALYTLPGDTISRQGPRVLQGAQAVCGALDDARARRQQTP
jgi:iron complex transport system substrate-binding protein